MEKTALRLPRINAEDLVYLRRHKQLLEHISKETGHHKAQDQFEKEASMEKVAIPISSTIKKVEKKIEKDVVDEGYKPQLNQAGRLGLKAGAIMGAAGTLGVGGYLLQNHMNKSASINNSSKGDVMNKSAIFQEIRSSAFKDEMSKIAVSDTGKWAIAGGATGGTIAGLSLASKALNESKKFQPKTPRAKAAKILANTAGALTVAALGAAVGGSIGATKEHSIAKNS